MSMLQQILEQMFVDPEILDALDEEQKQILFIKMREEQIKRWKTYEEKYEKDNPVPKKPSNMPKRIQWLTGSDGEVWVWVMGEHKDDLSIEEIMERRALEEARQLAEKEMLESIRLTELEDNGQPCLFPNEDESTLKQQLSRMGVSSNADSKAIQESMYEDADAVVEPLSSITAMSSSAPAVAGSPSNSVMASDGSYRIASYGSQNSSSNANNSNGFQSADSFINAASNKTADGPPPPVPVRPPRLKHIASQKNESGRQQEISLDKSASVPARWTDAGKAQPFRATAISNVQQNQFRSVPQQSSGTRTDLLTISGANEIASAALRNANQIVVPVADKTALEGNSPREMLQGSTEQADGSRHTRAAWEEKSSTLPAKFDVSSRQPPSYVKMRPGVGARTLLTDEDISKRQSEIYEMIKEKHQKFVKEAELEAERVRHAWEEQERKAREAEAQIRQIAQKAREQHRQQSLRTSTSILPALKDTNASSLREAIKNLPRPPKPKSRQAIVDWFRIEELQRGTGLDPKTRLPAPWFHGIISRDQADELLRSKPSGSFLVRVSERIWGYTVSYVVGNGDTKHFLIERIPQGYQFLGTNQVVHDHLYDLITYHETAPITVKGNEILKWAVGQTCSPPDYADLIVDFNSYPVAQSHTLPSSFYRRF